MAYSVLTDGWLLPVSIWDTRLAETPIACARARVQFAAECGDPFLQADQAEAAAVGRGRELGAAAAVVRDRDGEVAGVVADVDGDLGGVGRVAPYVRQGLLDDPEGCRLH